MNRMRRAYADAGTPPVRRRELWAWAGFDFANSGYTTVVITAIFNAYFVSVVAAGADWATFAWTAALSLSYAIVVATAPLLGLYADAHARKRRLLMVTTLLCATGTAALWFCGPGDVALALVLIVLTNAAFGTGENLIAAFLPELARDEGMGRLSGYGWALGYGGAVLLLAVCLWWVMGAEERGSDTSTAVRETLLLTGATILLAALPTFLLLKERTPPAPQPFTAIWAASKRRWRGMLGGVSDLPQLQRFLFCIIAFQAGVGTVITIAAIYTTEALGFTPAESIQLVLVVNITAAVGAALFGHLQDRIGHRNALALALVGWLLAIGLLAASDARAVVWTAANLAGICMGASQSAGRALVGVLCPAGREAEVFGLWGFAVKTAMILGPLGYGIISWMTEGRHELAMGFTALFFVLGLVLLARVDVARGRLEAGRSSA
ncbi:MFS transporter [Silanimonas sp.]|uniref:MFS transporter n=1 Tax=Silanimonas sp. TaxID=1929290 RepID=UPI001BB9F371|nr:MFS transporter [Silanimonas sp.]MBS3895704.1 MFS transporter [Silanimonas sp.]MBS3924377.1 MFS transporter [Xanthomonadaceae bacterium]